VGGAIGVFFVAIALLFLLRFASGRGWLTPTVLVLLATLAGVACVIAGMHLKKREHRHANTVLGTGVGVLVVAHVAVLFGLLWIFSVASDGQAKATSAWGAYGIVLLLASYVLEQRGVQVAGLGTLLLAAVKLLIFDWFAPISAMWRISMFLGFGLGFIALSYSVFRRQEDP